MKSIAAILSMLHEPAGHTNSATRLFRTEPVLAWTLHRVGQSRHINSAAILCWDDQLKDVEPIAEEHEAFISVRTPRTAIAEIESVAASRRWADGWRGGLLGACEFDRGFYAPWALEILDKLEADAIVLIDPAAALIDPVLVDRLIEHAQTADDIELCFSQAAPGLSGVLLRKAVLSQLASAKTHPGALLCYRPDLQRRDPISGESCAPIASPLARTPLRFTLDSDRQIQKISAATVHLNGQLISSQAEQILQAVQNAPQTASLPRELVLELTTRRATKPIFQPSSQLQMDRPDLTLDHAGQLIADLARADDARLTLAGIGDPLMHPNVLDIIDVAADAGITAISLETDLIGIGSETIFRLADSPVDIISVHIPATSQPTYQAVMGVDAIRELLANLRLLIERRQLNNRGTPLIVPTFVKCAENIGEMEAWYDHWLKLLQCAVITGPSDFAGEIPAKSVVAMAPPRRRACTRISSRLTVLSDGQCVSCEQDIGARQSLGRVGAQTLAENWANLSELRHDHEAGKWNAHPTCAKCSEWHRP